MLLLKGAILYYFVASARKAAVFDAKMILCKLFRRNIHLPNCIFDVENSVGNVKNIEIARLLDLQLMRHFQFPWKYS
ncbi:MAG: hypothetical protein LUC19_03405 [Oscillospiraceae bacterium]|nr:hypothetical protein [Oscillospiraceae bacterium]MCD8374257.1 hypothetical protein [Oscillospiraceae bacterium]